MAHQIKKKPQRIPRQWENYPLCLRIYHEIQEKVKLLKIKIQLRLGGGYNEYDPIDAARELESMELYLKRFEDQLDI